MFDIIILFIVISMVIANILKHTGNPGQWTKPDTADRSVTPESPKMPGRPGDSQGISRQPSHQQVQMAGAGTGKYASAERGPVASGYAVEGEGAQNPSFEGMWQEGRLPDTAHNAEASKLEILSPVSERPLISLSRNAIINGIIMSELLQPPKALRKKF